MQTLAALEDPVQTFGDGMECKELRLYIAFKTLRNFVSVVLQHSRLLVYLHLDAAAYVPQIQQHIPATRDVSIYWAFEYRRRRSAYCPSHGTASLGSLSVLSV